MRWERGLESQAPTLRVKILRTTRDVSLTVKGSGQGNQEAKVHYAVYWVGDRKGHTTCLGYLTQHTSVQCLVPSHSLPFTHALPDPSLHLHTILTSSIPLSPSSPLYLSLTYKAFPSLPPSQTHCYPCIVFDSLISSSSSYSETIVIDQQVPSYLFFLCIYM